ncbi:hypothetical protein [Caulobacter sp. LARHSG274]
MRVYGDRAWSEPVGQAIGRLEETLGTVEVRPAGLERHAALVGGFIEAAQLLQGVADAEMALAGHDAETPVQAAGMDMLLGLAGAVARSWRDGTTEVPSGWRQALARWRDLDPPSEITCKLAEGYAHYALYPEAYLEAAAAAERSAPPVVLGLRSIGTGLAAMVAVGAGARRRPVTVRPVGPPFARRLRLSPALYASILGDGEEPYAVVDEGPGLSGSSFGAVGDLLEEAGVSSPRVTYLPSHAGEPGPHASPAHRERWRRARRLIGDFEGAGRDGVTPSRRLDDWVSELVGPLTEPRRDLSAGRWREVSDVAAPVLPALERRKFLFRAASGSWLAKFAGLGGEGVRKTAQAGGLAAAGFTPRPAGLRHGFLVETWLEDARALEPGRYDRGRLLDHLARYLAFRARHFPASVQDGAGTSELLDMARVNTAEALGEPAAEALHERLRVLARTPAGAPIAIDGRLHAWEWRVTPQGRLLKTDAVDHARGHDLVGCQDVGWDVAGAQIELDLSDDEAAWLARAIERLGGGHVAPARLALHRACYAAFQIGLWSLGDGLDPAEQGKISAHALRYRRALLRFVQPDEPGRADPSGPRARIHPGEQHDLGHA